MRSSRDGELICGMYSLSLALWLITGAGSSMAADWSRWRGPNGDGISREKDWNPKSLAGGAKTLWAVDVGEGYAAASVSGKRVFTMGNIDDQDRVCCLDADTGKEIWHRTYACKKGDHPGPRATPVLDGDRLYTLSREGDVYCLNSADGKVLWQKNIMQGTGVENIGWGLSSSPVVAGDLVLVNAGRAGVALNKTTGSIVWSEPGKGGYASPVPYESGGKPCAAIFGQNAVCGVTVADGKLLWSFPWETRYDVNAPDPIVAGDRVFISSGYGRGCALLRIEAGEAKPVWENQRLRCHFSSCVLIDGFIYGIDGNAGNGTLRCLDLESGLEKWSKETGFGALMAADGKLIVLTEKGTLIVAQAQPTGYTEIARAEGAVPVKGKCWTMPVLCGGRIYCRDSAGALVCIDVGK